MKLTDLYKTLPQGARVLDVGCLGFNQWKLAQKLERPDLHHAGVDYCPAENIPDGFVFRLADLNRDKLPFEDDSFDLVVAGHVIEHLEKPVDFFGDCVRVCKPGGLLYVESPSERSLFLPGFPFAHEKFYSTSFFDDPTHVGRPFSPQAFVRLAMYYGCTSVDSAHLISWKCRLLFPVVFPLAMILRKGWLLEYITWQTFGWASYIIASKPLALHGQPALNYYLPKNRNDDWLSRLVLKIIRVVSKGF